jgi:ribosomal protein L11 methyltransferase (prmA)
MKPDYKNWVPRGLLFLLGGMAIICLALCIVFGMAGVATEGGLRIALGVLFGAAFLLFAVLTGIFANMYCAFSYHGKKQVSKRVIEGIAQYVALSDGGKGLDVGCGSGALTVACAKRNPRAQMVGIDRWGKEYASFNLPLCERNAEAEGVRNVSFVRGNAVKLGFTDGTFDAVTSNYVYHNIKGKDKQQLLVETLRVLKKGGTFAIHDIMSPREYGDMRAFVKKLKEYGYEKVELIDTTDGLFLTKKESRTYMLAHSKLLVGKK